jgi:hypothetical protein
MSRGEQELRSRNGSDAEGSSGEPDEEASE